MMCRLVIVLGIVIQSRQVAWIHQIQLQTLVIRLVLYTPERNCVNELSVTVFYVDSWILVIIIASVIQYVTQRWNGCNNVINTRTITVDTVVHHAALTRGKYTCGLFQEYDDTFYKTVVTSTHLKICVVGVELPEL